MVNTENQLIHHRTIIEKLLQSTTLGAGFELAARLYQGGHAELASIAAYAGNLQAFVQDAQSQNWDLNAFVSRVGAPVLTDYRDFSAVELVLSGFEKWEKDLAGFLAFQARRDLNTVRTYPPQATQAARLLETLLCVSPCKNENSSAFATRWRELEAHFQVTLATFLSKPELQRKSLNKGLPQNLSDTLFQTAQQVFTATQCSCHVLAQLVQTMRGAESQQTRVTAEKGFGAVKVLHERLARDLCPSHIESQQLALANAQAFLFERNYPEFCYAMSSIFYGLEKLLASIRNLDQSFPLSIRHEHALAIENTFYIEGLKKQLIRTGEVPYEVDKLAEALFRYTTQHLVAGSDVIDDEMLKCNPSINRESITRARLDLRLKDTEYPLSVAHKDWISKVADAATAEHRVQNPT